MGKNPTMAWVKTLYICVLGMSFYIAKMQRLWYATNKGFYTSATLSGIKVKGDLE